MSKKVLCYSEFGAVGNGINDDFEAIIRTHEAANEGGNAVCASPDAVYYIGGGDKTVQIKTDTDWNTARFIIDDTKVENRSASVFRVGSMESPQQISGVKSLSKMQEKLEVELQFDSLVVAMDDTTMRYIREGANQDSGMPQTDIFIVRKNGEIDMATSPIWDYDNITSLTAYPIDSKTLNITGGHFTTIANNEASEYKYFNRNIAVQRSNVVIDGLTHVITDEPADHSAPYLGFFSITNCSNITIQNCKLSAHKIFSTIGSRGQSVSMGTYDILAEKAVNLLFKDCVQLNDITDTTTWGIFGSNFTKNITFDSVVFSRFDAHKGTTNPIIRNSEIGHMGLQLIGSGTCVIENTKVFGHQFINLRGDYGSTWEGEIIIRNCEFTPLRIGRDGPIIIRAHYSGQHDFGYQCYMPQKITIDGFIINDVNSAEDYQSARILSNLHPNYLDVAYVAKYPYKLIEEIEIRKLSTKSGKPWVLSDNMSLYKDVKVK